MRFNDIANQYTALNEISVRTAETTQPSAQSRSNAADLSAIQPRSNGQYDRQLQRARGIANERAEQANDDFVAAQRREEAIRESGTQSREIASIIDRVREGDLEAENREALQARFNEILSRFDSANAPSDSSSAPNEETFPSIDRNAPTQSPSSGELGRAVSERFTSLEAVSELNFAEASPEELAEATAVVESSTNTLNERERQASIEVNARQNERNVFANVAQALDGNADFSVSEETQISEREERLQRDTQAAQELVRQFDSQRSQNPILSPGSLFNLLA